MEDPPHTPRLRPRLRLQSDDCLDQPSSSGTVDLEQLHLDDIHKRPQDISGSDILVPDVTGIKSIELSECSIRDEPDCSRISPVSSVEAEHIFNPFELRSRQSVHVRTQEIIDSLNFHAVELVVECAGLVRKDNKFSTPKSFLGVFCEGIAPGQWQALDLTEDVVNSPDMRFVKKFRLRAATAKDREERMLVAIFDQAGPRTNLNPMKGICHAEFTVGELVESKQMITEKELEPSQRSAGPKAKITLALEMIHHVEQDHQITFDIGFLNSAPLRNRMYFVISRALRRGKWSPVYSSEVRLRENVEKFDPVRLSAIEFHGGNMAKLFRIEVYRYYKNGHSKLLGFIQTSCEKLSSMDINGQLYWWPAREGITSAKVLIQYVENKDNEVWYSLRVAGHP